MIFSGPRNHSNHSFHSNHALCKGTNKMQGLRTPSALDAARWGQRGRAGLSTVPPYPLWTPYPPSTTRAAASSASCGRGSEDAAGAALRFSQSGPSPACENRLSARGQDALSAAPLDPKEEVALVGWLKKRVRVHERNCTTLFPGASLPPLRS